MGGLGPEGEASLSPPPPTSHPLSAPGLTRPLVATLRGLWRGLQERAPPAPPPSVMGLSPNVHRLSTPLLLALPPTRGPGAGRCGSGVSSHRGVLGDHFGGSHVVGGQQALSAIWASTLASLRSPNPPHQPTSPKGLPRPADPNSVLKGRGELVDKCLLRVGAHWLGPPPRSLGASAPLTEEGRGTAEPGPGFAGCGDGAGRRRPSLGAQRSGAEDARPPDDRSSGITLAVLGCNTRVYGVYLTAQLPGDPDLGCGDPTAGPRVPLRWPSASGTILRAARPDRDLLRPREVVSPPWTGRAGAPESGGRPDLWEGCCRGSGGPAADPGQCARAQGRS